MLLASRARSSITNVAVDRVLEVLLSFGFQDFVRIGSVKKIAKAVLPYRYGLGLLRRNSR